MNLYIVYKTYWSAVYRKYTIHTDWEVIQYDDYSFNSEYEVNAEFYLQTILQCYHHRAAINTELHLQQVLQSYHPWLQLMQSYIYKRNRPSCQVGLQLEQDYNYNQSYNFTRITDS